MTTSIKASKTNRVMGRINFIELLGTFSYLPNLLQFQLFISKRFQIYVYSTYVHKTCKNYFLILKAKKLKFDKMVKIGKIKKKIDTHTSCCLGN